MSRFSIDNLTVTCTRWRGTRGSRRTGATPGRSTLSIAGAFLGALLLSFAAAPAAYANFEQVATFGEENATPNWLGEGLQGAAINRANGALYIANQAEVMRYSASGQFEAKFGWDVVAQGPDNSTADKREMLTLEAEGGTFTIESFVGAEKEETARLPYDATASEVQAALDALPSIGGVGGSVTVTGGPGGEHGYQITYEGALSGDSLPGGSQINATGLTGSKVHVDREVIARGGAFEICEPANGDVCKQAVRGSREHSGEPNPENAPEEASGAFITPASVAVDQANGDVYVLDDYRLRGIIQVFTARGEYVTSFGEREEGESATVSGTPESIHTIGFLPGLTVSAATGDVYILDYPDAGAVKYTECRVMTWRPTLPPVVGYEYAGQAEDLFVNDCPAYANQLGADEKGDFFLASSTTLYEFEAGHLNAPARKFSAGAAKVEMNDLAVDPADGNVFFYSYTDERFHELRPGEGGAFLQVAEFPAPAKEFAGIVSTVFDPARSWSAGRASGIFYALSQTIYSGTKQLAPPRALAFAPPEEHPPSVREAAVSGVGTSVASLNAEIDPSGFPTSYRFVYGDEGPCSEYPCREAPSGGASAGEGGEPHDVGVSLSGLQANTTYYWRVEASNVYGSVQSEGPTFTTFASVPSSSPDKRAYELVSPAQKFGGEVFPLGKESGSCQECEPGEVNKAQPMQSSPNGEAVVYPGYPFSPSGDAVNENEYRSTRTASGWTTEAVSSEFEERGSKGFVAFAEGLETSVFGHVNPPLAAGAPEGFEDLYLRQVNGALTPLVTTVPSRRGARGVGAAAEYEIEYAGAPADFSDVFFGANEAFTQATAFAPAAQDPCVVGGVQRCGQGAPYLNLYDWTAGGLALVNVLPGNRATAPDAVFGSGYQLEGYGNSSPGPDLAGAISASGRLAYWTDLENGHLYLRLGAQQTLEVPDPGSCARAVPQESRVCFVGASKDGSHVLLSDGAIYALQGEAGLAMSHDLGEGKSGYEGTLGYSEDMSTVYFVDTAALTAANEANAAGEHSEAGADNLYVWRDGATKFIAQLWPDDNTGDLGLLGDWRPSPSDRMTQVSADGQYLAFTSYAPLTRYNNLPAQRGERSCEGPEGRCTEVYEYEADAHALDCASCNPTGVRPSGGSRLALPAPGSTDFPAPHSLTAEGRLFFNSFDVLSPRDERGGVENVYEYERDGQGSCTLAGHCVALISSGRSVYDSSFVDASSTGSNVFFTTREGLVPEDHDGLVDLYDARERGGFAQLTSAQCTGAGCQGVPNAPPIFATPASFTFSGVGKFAASGTVKTGKCMAKKGAHRRRCRRKRKRRRGAHMRRRAACRRHARELRCRAHGHGKHITHAASVRGRTGAVR